MDAAALDAAAKAMEGFSGGCAGRRWVSGDKGVMDSVGRVGDG